MKRNLFFKLFFLASFLAVSTTYAGNGKSGNQVYKLQANVTPDDYLPNKIVLKVKPEFRGQLNQNGITLSSVKTVFNELGINSMEQMFPHSSLPETEVNSWGAKLVDITVIYKLDYTANVGIETAINKLIATNAFQYVEPYFIHHVTFWPSDPNNGLTGQYFLKTIKCDSAWDVIKGDTNVVIGIVDSGTDPNHPDLMGNLKHNYADPVDGADNDGDGYVDNYSGWDLSDNDNNPTVGSLTHGVNTSGCAAAVTNNSVGVSSPGFLCKFMPIKAATNSSTSAIDRGYEGITYAADHLCQIINCSWGGPGFSQAGQDVITYATINKNSLVVASAGNNNTEDIQYPAAYDYVLNVAATTSADKKASFSSYGTWVSISAPGNAVYSTGSNANATSHTYASNLNGTSFSSPITAGAAGLVLSQFPTYNALQLKEQLRATADNIYPVNAGYIGKLGTGRVNVYRALTSTTAKSVGITNVNAVDGNDNAFVIGDTLRISGDITNYLSPTTNLVVTMSSTSPYVNVLPANNTLNLGAMNTMVMSNNSSTPFKAVILPGTPLNSSVTFTFTFTDGAYTSSSTYTVLVNVDYINITVNDVFTTVTSKSWMAYNDPDLTTRVQGLGFKYKGNTFAYEIGFMAGTDATHLASNVRVAGTTQATDNSIASVSNVRQIIPSNVGADFESTGIFNDANNTTPLNITVNQRTFAWGTPGDRKYVIVQYNIKNAGGSPLTNFYAGIFADWDIGANGIPDLANVNKSKNLGYVWQNVASGQYGGTKLLTHGTFNHYAIDNDTICPGINIYNTFTKAEKYTTLSTSKDNAGGCGGVSDVGNVVSSGPFTVNAGDSVTVAFALLAGDDLTDLETSADNAQIKYDGIFTGLQEISQASSSFGLHSVVPNPSSGLTAFHFNLSSAAVTELSLYNQMGQKVRVLINEKMKSGEYYYSADLSNLDAGIYFYHFQSGDNITAGKLTIMH